MSNNDNINIKNIKKCQYCNTPYKKQILKIPKFNLEKEIWVANCDCIEAIEKQKKIEYRMDYAKKVIPKLYYDFLNSKEFDLKRIPAKVFEYLENAKKIKNIENFKNIVLVGEPRTGKTTTACYIINQLIMQQDFNAKFIECLELEVRTYNNEDDIYRIPTQNFLILDNFGKNTSTKIKNFLFAVIDYRLRNKLPVVYTINEIPSEFDKKFDKALIERIKFNAEVIIYE